jgi:hypothetical protein
MAKSEIKMKMSLDSSGVTKALGRAKASVKNFANDGIERLNALGRYVAVGLVASFVAFTKRAIGMGSELSDIAESTGMATEQFQVFRGALLDAGGKAGSMEKAIVTMQKAIVQGSEGLTTYTRAFERLGLNVDKLREMSPEEQFQEIGKAIAGAEDQQGAFTAAQEIFGTRVAPRMMEVFRRLNTDGYGKMAEEIKNTYGVMDASTQRSLDKASDAIEQFKNRMTIKVGELIAGEADGAALKRLGLKLGIIFLEAGEMLVNGFLTAAKSLKAVLHTTMVWAGDKLAVGFQLAGLGIMKILEPFMDDLVALINKMPGIELPEFKGGDIDAQIERVKKGSREWGEILADVWDGMGEWKIDVSEGTKELERQRQIEQRKLDTQRKANDATKAGNDLVEEGNNVRKEIIDITEMELELIEAKARGDLDSTQTLERRIALSKRINELQNKHNYDVDKAREIAEAELNLVSQEQNMKKDLFNAENNHHDGLVHTLKKEMELRKLQLEIMKETGVAEHEALDMARARMQMLAGPDLDQSGFVTRREQREFDAMQKDRERAQKARIAQEKKEERILGGGLLKKRIPKDIGGEARARQRAEDRARRADLEEAGRRIRRGENKADVLADIDARRDRRLANQERIDKIENVGERAREKNLTRREEEALERAKKLGKDAFEKEKQRVEEARRQRGQQPGVPGDGKAPEKPKEPVNPVVKGLGPKIDETNKKLEAIKKLLTC